MISAEAWIGILVAILIGGAVISYKKDTPKWFLLSAVIVSIILFTFLQFFADTKPGGAITVIEFHSMYFLYLLSAQPKV